MSVWWHTRWPASAPVWWRRDWWVAAAVAAAVVTLLDIFLLQRRNSYFTGGFLSVHHLRGPLEAAIFVAILAATNLGVTGPASALAMWLGRVWRMGRLGRCLFVAGLAALPLVLAELVSYQVFQYFGSAFDFMLLFDLAGWDPAEVVAVVGPHALSLIVVALAALVFLLAVVAALNRWAPAGQMPGIPIGARKFWAKASMASFIVAVLLSTGARLSSASLENGFRRTAAGDVMAFVISAVTDIDRDGYGLLSRPADPAPFDASIYPWAMDVPGNGVDENGVAGDLPSDYPPYREAPAESPRFVQRPHVVLVVLESFRADVVGASIAGRPVTPTLDRLASAGVSAEAYSHNGYTVQSRFHLFSGSLAGLRGGTTLIDDFKANGYQVAYFSAQDESFGGPEYSTGYERADVFYDARADKAKRYSTFATAGSLAVPASVLRDRIQGFLKERRDDRPLFLYVNFHDTHFPYHHGLIENLVSGSVVAQGDISANRRDDLWAMYLNSAANVDREIGRVLDDVAKATNSPVGVIVTADHGESLFDGGFLGHGYALNEEQTRIPLIVHNLPMVVREPWGQSDMRDDLRAALAQPELRLPELLLRPGLGVFQYLGQFQRPGQVGLRSPTGQITYDFRNNCVGSPTCLPAAPLMSGERDSVSELVWTWESILFAARMAPLTERVAID